MTLIETLILGSYAYTTLVAGAIWKFLVGNHLKHVHKRLDDIEEKLNIPH